jgi:hypothetical protein
MNKTIQETIQEVFIESRKVNQTDKFIVAMHALLEALPDLNGSPHSKLQEEIKRLSQELERSEKLIRMLNRALEVRSSADGMAHAREFNSRPLTPDQLVSSLKQAIEFIESAD